MKPLAVLVFLTHFLLPGLASGKGLFEDSEFFSEPQLSLLRMLRQDDVKVVRGFVEEKGIDLNEVFHIADSVDLKKAYGLSRFERWYADRIFVPSGGSGEYLHETITLANYLILTDDLPALRRLMELGADPFVMTTWNGNSFTFACQFEKAKALDILFEFHPFRQFSHDQKTMLLRNLFTTETKNHWFAGPEYILKKALPEVALKHEVDFNLETDHGTYEILDFSLNGLDKVKWLIQNNAALDVIDKYGQSVSERVESWQASSCVGDKLKEDKTRCRLLQEIKEMLIAKGVKFPGPTREENLRIREASGKEVHRPRRKR